MFKKAISHELLSTNPCCLDRDELPRNEDKDSAWRGTAIYSRAEIEQIISDPRIPWNRRFFYALVFLAGGARFGEAASLIWGDYDATAECLGRITISRSYSTRARKVKGVKTGMARRVPVHPLLASILEEWRKSGWRDLMGRPPTEADLVIPSREGGHRSANHMLKKFHEDLARLGLRRRRQHDLRRAFISLAIADGARGEVLSWITHGPPRARAFDLYKTIPWETLCEEVKKLRISIVPAPAEPTVGDETRQPIPPDELQAAPAPTAASPAASSTEPGGESVTVTVTAAVEETPEVNQRRESLEELAASTFAGWTGLEDAASGCGGRS